MFFIQIISYFGTIDNSGKRSKFRTFSSNQTLFGIWIGKRSGRPEQWPKIPQKYDLIRRFWPFWGYLDEFGEIWISIWIKC